MNNEEALNEFRAICKECNNMVERRIAMEDCQMSRPTGTTFNLFFNGVKMIDIVKEATKNLRGIEAVYTADILEYMLRWRSVGGVEDLKKAKECLESLIRYENACNDPGCIEYEERQKYGM